MISYQIIYSKRRSISLIIDKAGNVVVRAPRGASESYIRSLVLGKEAWIAKNVETRKQQLIAGKKYEEGELFLFLGEEHPLRVIKFYRNKLEFASNHGFDLSLTLPRPGEGRIRKLFEDFYKQQAKKILLERANLYTRAMGVSFKKLNITSAGTRWGSCSSSGSINFSWRLVLAPVEIIDYVVVHELAHIPNKNHSQKFWKLVSQYYPDFKQARQWLNKHGHKLSV